MAERRNSNSRRATVVRYSCILPDTPYPMTFRDLGHAVIVNNVLGEFPGSKADTEALKGAYEKVGYETHLHSDCDTQAMMKLKRWFTSEDTHKNCNTFVLNIICHGNEKGHLMDSGRKRAWSVDDLVTELSTVESLEGKPKIIIIQMFIDDERLEQPQFLSDKEDLFLAYAALPRSHGVAERGSPYLQAFAKYFTEQYLQIPFDRIFLMVKQFVMKLTQTDSGIEQYSEERNGLTHVLDFSQYPSGGKGSSQAESKNQTDQQKLQKEMDRTEKAKMEEEIQTLRRSMERMKSEERERTQKMEEEIRKLKEGQVTPPSGGTQTMATVQDNTTTTVIVQESPRHISLKIKTTTDTGLWNWSPTTFSVMPSSGKVIVMGRPSMLEPAAYHVFEETNGELRKRSVITHFCEHETIHMLSLVSPQEGEVLAVSCMHCEVIRILNLDTLKISTALKQLVFYPAHMCYGDPGTLFVVHSVKGGRKIMKVDYNNGFIVKHTFNLGMDTYNSICYLPPYQLMAISNASSPALVRAISTQSGEKAWETFLGVVEGETCRPSGMLYLQAQDVLLVGDHNRGTRLLVLHPKDGTTIKNIRFNHGGLSELYFHRGTLFMLYLSEKYKLSALSFE